MRSVGYTLIELLVVIAIISILAGVSFVNFKGFSTDQATVGAQGQIQTLLRLAQSNAGSSTLCGTHGGASWSLIFKDNMKDIDLICGASDAPSPKTYTLTGAQVSSISGSMPCDVNFPFTITYAPGIGKPAFSFNGATATCLASDSWTITIVNTKDITKTRRFKLSKGGAIDVQQ